ncbi:MAG: hypothetical protein HY720_30355 [Planctomycetes bacterium]|nr:hypothetical protein [Planctomycetota bacterium]
MRELRVREAEAGMVLAKPVVDRMGRVLLQKGETLTQPILDRLEAWGVTQLFVDTGEDVREASGEHDPLSESDIMEAVDTRLAEQFQRHEGDARMRFIRESARKSLLKRQLKKRGG